MKTFVSYAVLCVFAVGLLATSGDITITYTSPIFPKLKSNDSLINPLITGPLTPDQDAWIGSLINIGALIGPLPFGFIAERFGRKVGLLCVALPHITAYLTMAFANNVYLFYFARLFGGLALGGGYTLLPMYIAEISEVSNRGRFSTTLNVFWSLGNFLPFAIGPFVSVMLFNIIVACLPVTFFVLFFFMGTETPYYLVTANKIPEAEESLMLLRSMDKRGVEKELDLIKAFLKKEEDGSFFDIIINPGLRKAFIISLMLTIFQQLSGSTAIAVYLQTLFEASGTQISPGLAAIVVGFCTLIASIIVTFIADNIGRRVLLIISTILMSLSLTMIGTFFYLHDNTNISTEYIFWMPVVSLVINICAFTIGLSIIPWTLLSELFPNNMKQISSTTVTSAAWLLSFIMTKCFNNMVDGIGVSGSFWFFAVCCFTCTIFTFYWVPETRGKSFNEIQDMLQNKNVVV